MHNARRGRYGAFSPKHNDRQFDIGNAEHIDPERSKNNIYWHWLQKESPQVTFEEAEAAFYEKYCNEHLTAQNGRYRAQRHLERVRTMDEYRTGSQTCPEEVIWMIGKKGDTIPERMLRNIIQEQINWEQKKFPYLRVLSIAVHLDETTPHIHERRAWLYRDAEGHMAIGQNKSLQQMNIGIPHPEKPRSRYNNRKQVYTQLCRQHFLQVCKEHGLEIEEQPLEKSRSGMSQQKYQTQQELEQARMAELRVKHANVELNKINIVDAHIRRQIQQNEICIQEQEKKLQLLENQLNTVKNFLHLAEQRKAFEIYCDREHERTR